jgi:guanylate kinase
MSLKHPVVVVIGPSASGKSTAVRELHRLGLVDVRPTWTTRPTRPDEDGGSLEHRFVTDAEFDALKAAGFFLDSVEMFGLPYRYGLPHSASAKTEIVMLRSGLVERFRAFEPRFVVFYIEDDSQSRMCDRLARRGASETELRARLADNEAEQSLGRAIADRVFVNDSTMDALVQRLADAIAHHTFEVAA